MTNSIVKFENQDIELITVDGQPTMTCGQIDRVLTDRQNVGAFDSGVVYRRHADEFTPEMTRLVKQGRTRVRVFNREGAWLIGMFARTPKAAAFRKWVLTALAAHVDGAKPVTVAEHQRALPSGKKEIVLSEKAKQEIDGIVKNCLAAMPKPKETRPPSVLSDGDLLKTLNLLSERIDNLGRNMTRGFPSAWERSVVRYAADAAQAVGSPAYAQTYVTKAEYDLLCSVRGVAIPLR